MEALVLTAGAWPLNQKDDTAADTNKLMLPAIVRLYFIVILDESILTNQLA